MKRLLPALLLLLITACTTTVTGAPTAPPGPLPDDQLVFRVSYGPGYSPEIVYLTTGPALSIYGDGRVMVTLADYPTIPQLEVGQLTPEEVAAFAHDARESGLFESGVQYGDAQVTDMGNTVVLLDDGVAADQLSVYALSMDSGLPSAQVKSREALRDLISTAFKLTDTTPATPDRIQVKSAGGTGAGEATVEWPGPAPAEFLAPSNATMADQCGVLEGAAAADVYEPAVTNDHQLWIVDGGVMLLAARPLLPDEQGCQD